MNHNGPNYKELHKYSCVIDLGTHAMQRWMWKNQLLPFLCDYLSAKRVRSHDWEFHERVLIKVHELWTDDTRNLRKDPIGGVIITELNDRVSWHEVVEWVRGHIAADLNADIERAEEAKKERDAETSQESTIVS